ncbi:uncharacterized protein MELLADRAFT_107709 [Melampsora larici-populina 98AG31]|uniref:Uncharacterized protein n=1 Tax=Melampsora larici-populina (strain 98AG31 / pathotype 3-4-7) TaxID=747676 RepID=F4RQP4_MELLP|nr:uncharacterized protein MELLADRAFT_107709 [Melampsora larici-populina 98AG31]EGG05071.1 hypothetical protein MELLADRAFT_107709 [Melampsora larici-populina 98AG31]
MGGLPGVVYLSDLLKVIDAKRQTGFNGDDPKSFIDVPHHLLAKDGFPLQGNWRDPACQKDINSTRLKTSGLLPSGVKEGLKSGVNEVIDPLQIPPKLPTGALIPSGVEEAEILGKRLPGVKVVKPKQNLPNYERQPMSLPLLYDLEQGKEGVRVPVAGKVQRGATTCHCKQAEKGIAAHKGDVSLGLEASKPGVSFRKDLDQPQYASSSKSSPLTSLSVLEAKIANANPTSAVINAKG